MVVVVVMTMTMTTNITPTTGRMVTRRSRRRRRRILTTIMMTIIPINQHQHQDGTDRRLLGVDMMTMMMLGIMTIEDYHRHRYVSLSSEY
jgi:hypothetical protein